MKRDDKLKILNESKGNYNLCRCFFKYNLIYFYYYICDVSDKFMLGLEEDDFIVNGFEIRKISDLNKVEIRNDVCTQINKEKNLLSNVRAPKINLSSWKDIFTSLYELDCVIIVENEELDDDSSDFAIGKILRVNKNNVEFQGFDSDGDWYDGIISIPYKYITSVTFNSRYCNEWEDYLKRNNKMI